MNSPSLTVVLPAYNEEHRLGAALDELFGYLRRRADRGRDGAPGAGHLPLNVHILVVDDGSTDGTAALVRARPEAAGSAAEDGTTLELLTVPHGGKGAAVRAGMKVYGHAAITPSESLRAAGAIPFQSMMESKEILSA